MTHGTYHIVNDATEDRYDEADSLDEAVRIARGVARDGRAGDPVSVEHAGRVVRQFVLTPDGAVRETPCG